MFGSYRVFDSVTGGPRTGRTLNSGTGSQASPKVVLLRRDSAFRFEFARTCALLKPGHESQASPTPSPSESSCSAHVPKPEPEHEPEVHEPDWLQISPFGQRPVVATSRIQWPDSGQSALDLHALARLTADWQMSQVSPTPSPSESPSPAFLVSGQVSHASPTPSPSLSVWSGLATNGQLSHSSPSESPSESV